MTYSGQVVCSRCPIMPARWQVDGRLVCVHCKDRMVRRTPTAVVVELPYRTAQLALPVAGGL